MATATQQNGQPGAAKKEEQGTNGRPALGGERRNRPFRGRPSPEERAEHNRERLQDPQSLLLLPRTPEGRVIVGMLFPLDKAVNRLRLSAGHSLSVGEVQAQLDRIYDWVNRGQELLKAMGVSEQDFPPASVLNYQYRLTLAGQRNARVITPRSEETKKVSRVAEKLDGVILHTRMSCDDLSQAEHLFTKIHELIRRLHELIADFCAQVELPYRTPHEAEDLFRERPDRGVKTPMTGGTVPPRTAT
jgi:hypothetical protein